MLIVKYDLTHALVIIGLIFHSWSMNEAVLDCRIEKGGTAVVIGIVSFQLKIGRDLPVSRLS